ncbi:AAA-like domain-containing protein [Gloeothece verrucosa]|uniref:AAA-like domain-containing protein n=1 Tax=Gloeothece verrucosa TaxID=2546359 RepID=UPI00017E239D|nr:AAA-like domain-containing protein [Gloeothece verrucosa]
MIALQEQRVHCFNLGRELKLPNKFNEYWDEEGFGTSAYQLQSMGLVKLAGNQVAPRCQLYGVILVI